VAKQKSVQFGITPAKVAEADAFVVGAVPRAVTKLEPIDIRPEDIPDGEIVVDDVYVAPQLIAMKRLTIDVPLDLHRKLKVKAAMEGVKMADLVRDWIKERCA
jgi:hypothetical protein